MTPVPVRIHQAAKTETGTRRRSATDQRRGRRPTSPTGSRTSPGTGVAASVGAPGAGASGPTVSSVRVGGLQRHEIPACLSTALSNGRSKIFLTLMGVVSSPSLRKVLASFCW